MLRNKKLKVVYGTTSSKYFSTRTGDDDKVPVKNAEEEALLYFFIKKDGADIETIVGEKRTLEKNGVLVKCQRTLCR